MQFDLGEIATMENIDIVVVFILMCSIQQRIHGLSLKRCRRGMEIQHIEINFAQSRFTYQVCYCPTFDMQSWAQLVEGASTIHTLRHYLR